MAVALAAHRPTWRSVDRFVALTTAIETHLQEYGVPADRIVVRPNGVPDPGPPAPLGDGFLFLGRLSPEKGLGLLLDAWARHPDGVLGTLRIAGDGEQRELAERAAAARSDVVYLGPLDRDGVRTAMRDSAVVLSVPVWHDVLPTVVIEALAAGRPVLGTALGGVPYLVGDTGWVAEPTAAALAEALPVARAGAAGRADAARARYESTFHPDVVIGQLLDIYRDATRDRRL
jgi:glycosyltransferase involved in cell wall biosynthesis